MLGSGRWKLRMAAFGVGKVDEKDRQRELMGIGGVCMGFWWCHPPHCVFIHFFLRVLNHMGLGEKSGSRSWIRGYPCTLR